MLASSHQSNCFGAISSTDLWWYNLRSAVGLTVVCLFVSFHLEKGVLCVLCVIWASNVQWIQWVCFQYICMLTDVTNCCRSIVRVTKLLTQHCLVELYHRLLRLTCACSIFFYLILLFAAYVKLKMFSEFAFHLFAVFPAVSHPPYKGWWILWGVLWSKSNIVEAPVSAWTVINHVHDFLFMALGWFPYCNYID